MSGNWILENMEAALSLWNEKLTEIWRILTEPPEAFRGGAVWAVVESVYGTLQAVGYALLVLTFAAGVLRVCGSFAELRRPATAFRLFVRFGITKGVITYGMELMKGALTVSRGIVLSVLSGTGSDPEQLASLPDAIARAVESANFFESIPLWAVTLLGSAAVWAVSFYLILSVYGRFFRLYLYTAIAPIPLAAFGGEPTQQIGISFLKSYAGVCLEGAVVVLSCVLYSAFASSPPDFPEGAAAATMVWQYLGDLIFHMLILVGCVRLSDRVVKEMFGL